MIEGANFIAGAWEAGQGPAFEARDPATLKPNWRGRAADAVDIARAATAAHRAYEAWARAPFAERRAVLERCASLLKDRAEDLARAITADAGKPHWEAMTEAAAIAGKVAISLTSYEERTGEKTGPGPGGSQTHITHRPHGVMAVIGPFNFPGHLANGHIVPALLAGNACVFKPSEKAPITAEALVRAFEEAGLPKGLLNLVHGGRETAEALLGAPELAGVLFTGSARAGAAIHQRFGGRPDIMLALEMGGNNPLIAWDVGDAEAAARLVIASAFITAGQRCTCARRLIVPTGEEGDRIIDATAELIDRVRVGPPGAEPEVFSGPVIDAGAADAALRAQTRLLDVGARAVREMKATGDGPNFLTPGLLDVTQAGPRQDEETFAPLLQVIRVKDFEAAVREANDTRYGLAAGLLSDDPKLWEAFKLRAQAGIVNWNRQTTGASSAAPFGGIGISGNHRPSAYYAADYCAYPMAGLAHPDLTKDAAPLPKGVGE